MFKKFFKRQTRALEETDPDRIYIENIRSIFNISSRWAKYICKIAVRQGILKRKFAVECKNNDCLRVIKTFDNEFDIPEIIECRTCELEGQEFILYTKELNIVEYYQYIDVDADKKTN
jgi:hypothetical protein